MVRVLLAAWLAIAQPAPIRASAQSQPVAPSIAPFTARTLAPGVQLLAPSPDYGGAVPGNVTVIEQADGMVVIDSGQTIADGRRVVEFIRSISSQPVKALVFTHWHGDHTLGASELLAAWPQMRILSTAPTLETLNGPARRVIGGLEPNPAFITGMQDQLRALVARVDEQLANGVADEQTRQRYERARRDALARIDDYPGTHLVLPTESFMDELVIDDGQRPVRLMFLGRANTDGDAFAWLPEQRILVTGDVVVAPIPFGTQSFAGNWIEVLEQLGAMPFAILVPGHGEPQSDTSYIRRLIASLRDLRSQVGTLARQGLSLEETRARYDKSIQINLFGDTPRHRAQLEAFWLTPMIENAYREAVGLPIPQGEDASE